MLSAVVFTRRVGSGSSMMSAVERVQCTHRTLHQWPKAIPCDSHISLGVFKQHGFMHKSHQITILPQITHPSLQGQAHC